MQASRTIDFSFMGFPAHNLSVSQNMGSVEKRRCGLMDTPIAFIRGEPDPATIYFQLSYNDYIFNKLQSLRHGCQNNFVGAYPSGVCQHCGSYFPAGLLKCGNCGGYVSDELVSVKSSRYEVISISTDDILFSECDLSLIDIELAILDNASSVINILNSEFLPTGLSLNENYIICSSCLCIVAADSICGNCGSARLPFSEVIKIDRECVFCGTKTYDGIMCKTCGTSLTGVSYREYKKKL